MCQKKYIVSEVTHRMLARWSVLLGKKIQHPVQLPEVYLLSFSLGVPPNGGKLVSYQVKKTNNALFSFTFVSEKKGKKKFEGLYGFRIWEKGH